MERIIKWLEPIVRLNIRYPWRILAVGLVLAMAGGYQASKLRVDTDIANLLPSSHPSVQALEELQAISGAETEMAVAVKSPDFEANLRFSRDLIQRALEEIDPVRQQPFFHGAELRRDNAFLKKNALYLATGLELDAIAEYLQEEVDRAREEANPFFIDFFDDFEDDFEDDVDGGVDGGVNGGVNSDIEDIKEDDLAEFAPEDFKRIYNELIPEEYTVSPDSTLLMFKMFPTGSRSDIRFLEDLFASFERQIAELDPASYHPDMEIRFGGRLKRHLSELESIMNDVFNSFSTGIGSVILLVLLYFSAKKMFHYRRTDRRLQRFPLFSHLLRFPVPAVIIGVPLVMSLMWTFGLTSLFLGSLNTMTSVLFVILFGLGIDYGIHLYARYIEFRTLYHMNPANSILESYRQTGTAIMVSAITTSVALFVLVFADFRGFSEFGLIAGMGILFALISMLFTLPSILVILERWRWIILVPGIAPSSDASQGAAPSTSIFNKIPVASTLAVFGIVTTVTVLLFSGRLSFEYNFSKLEPVFEEYEAYQAFISDIGQSSRRNPAFIVAQSDEDVFALVEEIRKRKANNPETMIMDVEALQERFPPTEVLAQEKLQKIDRIRTLLASDFLRERDDENLNLLRESSQTRTMLREDQIPGFLKNPFLTNEGEIGKFVIIYPESGLSDGLKSIAFKNELSDLQVGDRTYFAGSTSIVAASMLELMHDESPWMVLATFVMIMLFIFYSFRSPKWSLISLIPLLIGFSWLFGLMLLFGLKFNFYNLVVIPAILGIGCDNGVHLAHRFREEGVQASREVLKSTGQHISIGSLTTMLGFAGLLFTQHPGLQSIGVMAVLGIGMTLLSALVLLPSVLQILEKIAGRRSHTEILP